MQISHVEETYEISFEKLDSLQASQAPSQPKLSDPNIIFVDLKDLLVRIPPEALLPGRHDGNMQIPFTIEELMAKIEAGNPMIAVADIALRCSGVINPAAFANENPEIYFPWHKIVQRVRRYRARNPKPERTAIFTRREFSPDTHAHPEELRISA